MVIVYVNYDGNASVRARNLFPCRKENVWFAVNVDVYYESRDNIPARLVAGRTGENIMSNATPTISSLNNGANPLNFGLMLGSDGQGNQLWLFRDGSGDDNDSGLVANRHCDDEGAVLWSDDVTGWNYDPATDCIPA
jgi:hypothetical protein